MTFNLTNGLRSTLGAALLAAAAMSATPAMAESLPPVSAVTADARSVVLTEALEASTTLVILSRNARDADRAETWMRVAEAVRDGDARFGYFALDLAGERIEDNSGLYMASAPVSEADPRWIEAAAVKADIENAITMRGEDMQVVLVDASGDIRWRAQGGVTPEKIVQLGRAIDLIVPSAE